MDIDIVTHQDIVVDVPTAKKLLMMVDEDTQQRACAYIVSQYKRDILNGTWISCESIMRISNTGKFIDGQHRCLAVIEAQKPLPSKVILITGVKEETGTV